MRLFTSLLIASGALADRTGSHCRTGTYPHASDCTLFYTCWEGKRFEDQKCPDGLHFNAASASCDYPESAECRRCENGAKRGHESECAEYYQCYNNTETVKKCPYFYSFDSEKGYCRFSWYVDCEGGDDDSEPEEQEESCPTGIYPHESDCTKFFQCWEGDRKEDQSCPNGLHYNPSKEYCDYPENAKCDAGGEEETCRHGEKRADETDCNKYIKCYRGTESVKTCPFKYNFDPEKKYCRHKYFVVCGTNEPAAEEVCRDGIYVHETDCSKFFQCSEGHRFEDQSCPAGLLFNADKGFCDYSDNVKC